MLSFLITTKQAQFGNISTRAEFRSSEIVEVLLPDFPQVGVINISVSNDGNIFSNLLSFLVQDGTVVLNDSTYTTSLWPAQFSV